MKIRYNIPNNMCVLLFVFTILACRNERVKSDGNQVQTDQAIITDTLADTIEVAESSEIPTPCIVITPEEVKKVFNIKRNVGKSDISSGLKPNTKTCYFYWENENGLNPNIIVEIQKHTQDAGMGASPAKYIEDLLSLGMEIRGINERIPFNAFDAAGKTGAYSFKQGRYFWAANDTYVFMVVVNIADTEEKVITTAMGKLAEILNGNLDKL